MAGSVLGTLIGAFAMTVYTNVFAWRMHSPASIVLIPSVLILVPGAVSFMGLSTWKTIGASAGFEALLNALLIIVAIIAGLILANSVVPPKITL